MKKYNDKYDNGTFYIVISKEENYSGTSSFYKNDKIDKLYDEYAKDKKSTNIVKAWSDDKELVEFYIKFHNCKHFDVIVIDTTLDDIYDIINPSGNDEIKIVNLAIRDPDKPHKEKYIKVPMTEQEIDTMRLESESWGSDRINYHIIEKYYRLLKNKYKKIFNNILLLDILENIRTGSSTKILKEIKYDQLMLLYRTFPDNFN